MNNHVIFIKVKKEKKILDYKLFNLLLILGVITLSQWSSWARRMPSDQMETVLEFNIIPPDINMEAHRAFTSQNQDSPLVAVRK